MEQSINQNKKKSLTQIDVILFYKNNGTIEYLLLKRLESRGGFWQPVTGGVYEGEDNLFAARREVAEETGFLSVKAMYDLKYSFSFKSGEKILTEIVYAFEVDNKNVKILDNEHEKFIWLPYKEAYNLLKWDTNKKALTKINDFLTESY